MLHITNGESAGDGIRHTGIAGEVLTWDDVLHEGPTPAGLSLEQMSKVRARFIAAYYTLPDEEVMRDFTHRDMVLARWRDHEEVVLWFEHDLYDQLQLIQLLDWFAQQEPGGTRLSLICIDSFPGFDHFMGLGQLTPAQLASLFDSRKQVTRAILKLGGEAWSAFCSPVPLAVEALSGKNTTALPFLERALLRHLQEYPALENGLSRTEKHILEIVVSGVRQPAEIFRAEQSIEENACMGDMTFWIYLAQLCGGSRPLLNRADGVQFSLAEREGYNEAFLGQMIVPTQDGEAVLDARADWIALRGGIDRWYGGVHLQGQDAAWRWNGEKKALVRKEVDK
jgi:hypothetical protein